MFSIMTESERAAWTGFDPLTPHLLLLLLLMDMDESDSAFLPFGLSFAP